MNEEEANKEETQRIDPDGRPAVQLLIDDLTDLGELYSHSMTNAEFIGALELYKNAFINQIEKRDEKIQEVIETLKQMDILLKKYLKMN